MTNSVSELEANGRSPAPDAMQDEEAMRERLREYDDCATTVDEDDVKRAERMKSSQARQSKLRASKEELQGWKLPFLIGVALLVIAGFTAALSGSYVTKEKARYAARMLARSLERFRSLAKLPLPKEERPAVPWARYPSFHSIPFLLCSCSLSCLAHLSLSLLCLQGSRVLPARGREGPLRARMGAGHAEQTFDPS